ncbi:FMN-binding protein MioC [Aestuariibacter halophilus]|uniref:FMN-binding protein MioC n=1 Tax=Fluctibacter halophilus TaxID=226011 RepID=A0ABS8G9Q9_9ALTE|nr:FMN-binding protein MioC [Aestuariibacter halophilus]MCC2616931.1 FMN-binding protein MioC [Aestuariibacter halophilus]
MAHIEIIVGSVLGASEYVADALSEVLQQHGHHCNIHLTPDMPTLRRDAIWLVCSSTHGAGDLPDNIQPWFEQLKSTDLTAQPVMLIGLGDSSYDTYCHGAIKIEQALRDAGAEMLHAPLHIDVLNHPIPEDVAVKWLSHQLDKLG